MFLLLSNSRSLRAPWPTIRKGFGLGGCSSNCCSLLWWSSPPCDPIYIFHGKPAGASWWFAEVNAFIYTHTISVFIPKLERPDKSLDKNHFKIFVNRGRRRWKWHTHFPKLHIRVFAADAGDGDSHFYWDTDGIPYIVFHWSKRSCTFNSFQFTLQRYPWRMWHNTGHHILRGILLVPPCLRTIPKPHTSGEWHKLWMIHHCVHRRIWSTQRPTHKYQHQPSYLGNSKACLFWSSLLHLRQFILPSPNRLWGVLNKNIMLHTICPQ